MKHGSLFSGIGGFDLASEWMGWENVFHCEIEEFPRKVLEYYWPKAISYVDIKQTDFSIHRGRIDILTGGFPCQPYSVAGKRLGKNDDRHLWPHMFRAIREIKPTFIVGENVRGLLNWNGGMVFDEVQADLEAEGYEVIPLLLPACGVNAPHRRDRIWFVAHSNHERRSNGFGKVQEENGEVSEWNNNAEFSNTSNERSSSDTKNFGFTSPKEIKREWRECEPNNGNEIWDSSCSNGRSKSSSDTNDEGLEGHRGSFEKSKLQTTEFNTNNSQGQSKLDWEKFPTQSPICNGDDGISSRLDGITFSKWRRESIKAGGNAIVPQVAFEIFKAIDLMINK